MLCCRPVSHLIIPACSSSLRSRLFNFVRFGSSLFSLYFFHCFLVSSCLKRFYLLSSLELSRLSSKNFQPGSMRWKFCYTRHSHREIPTNFSSSLSTGRETWREEKKKRKAREVERKEKFHSLYVPKSEVQKCSCGWELRQEQDQDNGTIIKRHRIVKSIVEEWKEPRNESWLVILGDLVTPFLLATVGHGENASLLFMIHYNSFFFFPLLLMHDENEW